MKLTYYVLEVRTLWSLNTIQREVLGAAPFVNKIYFSIGSLTPRGVRDHKLAKHPPGPENLCALWKKGKKEKRKAKAV